MGMAYVKTHYNRCLRSRMTIDSFFDLTQPCFHYLVDAPEFDFSDILITCMPEPRTCMKIMV